MKNLVSVNNYRHAPSIEMNGLSVSSCYNHNYYVGINNPNDIIMEECDDDGFWMYYRVNGLYEKNINGTMKVIADLEHIGNYVNNYYSIFDEGNPDMDSNGYIEIDTDMC